MPVQLYLFCVTCGMVTPDNEMNSKGQCCSCNQAIFFANNDWPDKAGYGYEGSYIGGES